MVDIYLSTYRGARESARVEAEAQPQHAVDAPELSQAKHDTPLYCTVAAVQLAQADRSGMGDGAPRDRRASQPDL